MSEILTKPEWIPYYIQRMKGSTAFKTMQDYEFGWYSKLLIELADSDLPGYLPNDVRTLWRLAGARTEKFFRERGGMELVARYFSRTDDGLWIYNRRMLEVLHEQGKKLTKRRRRCVSSLISSIQELPDSIPGEEFRSYMEMREKIHKPLTGQAVKLAVKKLETLREQGNEPKAVLEQSILNSWQGLWPIGAGNGRREHLARDTSGTNGGTAPARSFAEKNCATCGGSGWDTTSGKAVRCKCFEQNRQANANGSAAGR